MTNDSNTVTVMTFVALCLECGTIEHVTTAADDGWLLLVGGAGHRVDAWCWRCDRERRAAQMSEDFKVAQSGE